MTVDTGIVLVLTYLLVSAIIFFAFLFVVFALASIGGANAAAENGEKTSPGRNPWRAARLIGQWLSDRFGQPFVIENRPGAATNIATQSVVNAPPA
jgi:tripartite-type tricarboxylate transporter receptor subunit TctC